MAAAEQKMLTSVEVLQRTSAGLVFLICGRIAATILELYPSSLGYYSVAIFLALVMLFLMRWLGDSPLIRDLKEICLYDVLVAMYGFYVQASGGKFDTFWILATGIGYLKFTRLIWWGKDQQGQLLPAWPVFGLIGFFTRRHAQSTLTLRQKLDVYGACAIAMMVPACSWIFFGRFDEVLYLVPILFAILRVTKPLCASIVADDAAKHEITRQNAILETQVEMDANIKERNADLCHATHDIQSPVNYLLNMTQQLRDSNDSEQLRLGVKRIEAGLFELGDSLSEIITMAQITTKVTTPTDDIIHMGRMSYALSDRLDDLAYVRKMTFIADYADCYVRSNHLLLQRILTNLLMNAIAHSDSNATIRLILHCNANYCYVRVWDTGHGMAGADSPDRAANFANLLNFPRQRGEPNKAEGITILSGHGVGLRSVIRMCKTLNLNVTLVSRIGKGTMYRFRLPLLKGTRTAEELYCMSITEQFSQSQTKYN
ncbi:MAG: hypothetical protein RL748_3186 [Pseudomonadota bacterium]|jgi:signal transduction histidine kinase